MQFTTHSARIVHILEQSFLENKAVNFAVKGGRENRKGRIALMHYAIWNAQKYGEILFNEEKDAAALLVDSERKKYGIGALIQDLKLVFNSIGIFRVKKVMKREAGVKKFLPRTPHIYLWFIGVAPENQGQGAGGLLLQKIIETGERRQLPIYLVTSTERNFNFYEAHGFECIGEYSDAAFTSRIYRK
jgi:GNAT superfamily N-acetyltransferase